MIRYHLRLYKFIVHKTLLRRPVWSTSGKDVHTVHIDIIDIYIYIYDIYVCYLYEGVDGFVYMYLNLSTHSHLHLCKSNTHIYIYTYSWYCIYPQLLSTCKVLGGPLQLVQLVWQNLTGKMRAPLREYPATVCSLSIPAYAVLVGTWWYKFGYLAKGIFH